LDVLDCIVVGAGVVGLAVARALAVAGREVLILESADAVGTATSSRNSEVIHAGLYYAPDSLKARFCVPGRRALYAYCEARGVPHRRSGKLVVAASADETARLESIAQRARANGVDDLELVSATAAKAMEPALDCLAALHSPSTGIVDSHALMQAYLADAEEAGATLALRSPVTGGRAGSPHVTLRVGGAEPMEIGCRLLVNCAGLHALDLARSIEGFPAANLPEVRFAKGNYFVLSGHAPFSRLVYPVPIPGGLGVHLTLDLAGAARFGPDVEWVETIDYAVDPHRADGFYAVIRRYWPALADGALLPGYSGIRAKASRGGADSDFIIEGPSAHGVPGIINLFGIESPGLTSSLAIADHVAGIARAEAP